MAEEKQIRDILLGIRSDPDSSYPYKKAMDMVLSGDNSPELETIIRAGVKNGVINQRTYHDDFADFMAAADDKTFKKYSNLLTPEVRERFKNHQAASIKLKKFDRTRKEIAADKKHDIFVFVGADKFEKEKDGRYKRVLDVESFVKIDKYNPADLNTVSALKIRATTRENAHVYIVKLPAGVIKDKVTHHLEPWLLHLIDEHKVRI